MYSVDTSFLMDWQARYYPPDRFPTFQSRIETLIAEGKFQAIDVVEEETNSVGTPGLRQWLAGSGMIVALSPELQMEGARIEALYPDLTDAKSVHQSADAYVIALARLKGWTVLTQETFAHEKPKSRKKFYIPDVCSDLGIGCINLLGLMRREDWSF